VLQQLSDSARAFGHVMSSFCMKLQWPELAMLLKQCVADRFEDDSTASNSSLAARMAGKEVGFGGLDGGLAVSSRPLPELTRIRASVANALYQQGITNIEKLRDAPLEEGHYSSSSMLFRDASFMPLI